MRTRKKASLSLSFRFILLFILLLAATSFFRPAEAQNPKQEIISLPHRLSAEIINKWELDPLLEQRGRSYFLVSSEKLSHLKQVFPSLRVETANFPHLFKPSVSPTSKINPLTQGGLNGAYHSYSETAAELKKMASSHPQIARLYILGQSLENRNVYGLKISKNPGLVEDEPGLALIGGHHAREWISVEVPLLIAQHLVDNYSSNQSIRNIIDRAAIWVIPLVNPDGLDYSIFNYRLWRKNRRLNPDGSFGVDLNRNYSFQWGCDNQGSSPNPSSDTYRGSAPLSEPETLAVSQLFQEHNFAAAISYHSYSQTILYPWSYADQPTEDEALLQWLAEQMSRLIFQVHGREYHPGRSSSSLYLSNGDFADWVYGLFKIPAFTVELPPVDFLSGGFFNPENDLRSIVEENLPAVLFLAEWVVDNYPPANHPAKIKERLEDQGKNLVKKKSKLLTGKEWP